MIFLEFRYGETSLDAAAEHAAKEASGEQRGAVRQYLRDVEANEHDPGDLEQTWKKVAQECGWIIEGNARDFFLMVGKKLKKSPRRERRDRRHG